MTRRSTDGRETKSAVTGGRDREFARIMCELLRADPDSLCAFHLNLTRNLFCDVHRSAVQWCQTKPCGAADEFLLFLKTMMTDMGDETRKAFEAAPFAREDLLAAFEHGERRISITCHQKAEGGRSRWVLLRFHLFRNPYTADVETIVYSIDIDYEHKQGLIASALAEDEYDCIGLIDAVTRDVEYYYVSKRFKPSGERLSFAFDHRGNFVCCCDPACVGHGVGAPLCRDADVDDVVAFEDIRKALDDHGSFTHSYAHCSRRKQVSFRYLEPDRAEVMFSLRDVTDAFEREEDYAERLRQALSSAEKANAMKSDFLGNVSHDMRTPLNAILGYNKLALQLPDLSDEVRGYLENIETAGNTLLTLINDTPDLQKIETGLVDLKPEPLRCDEMIKSIVASVAPLMEKKHISFSIDNSRAVMATINIDATRVREIFVNLLSNAVKFTPEGGRIEMIIECVGLDAGLVRDRITVRDSGIGMTPEFIDKMYEPFSQERTKETRHIAGSGLGLSIVKRTVELMGGTIEVKSALGIGTEFVVSLDFERVEDEAPDADEEDRISSDISGLNILVCEDNDMNAEITRQILEMKGATATLAADGREGAAAFVRSEPSEYDLVLMDIRMPIMDGYAATKAIRASRHPRARTVPIVAMSADAYAEDIARALASGMNGHVSKPIDTRKLVSEIATNVKNERC